MITVFRLEGSNDMPIQRIRKCEERWAKLRKLAATTRFIAARDRVVQEATRR